MISTMISTMMSTTISTMISTMILGTFKDMDGVVVPRLEKLREPHIHCDNALAEKCYTMLWQSFGPEPDVSDLILFDKEFRQ